MFFILSEIHLIRPQIRINKMINIYLKLIEKIINEYTS